MKAQINHTIVDNIGQRVGVHIVIALSSVITGFLMIILAIGVLILFVLMLYKRKTAANPNEQT